MYIDQDRNYAALNQNIKIIKYLILDIHKIKLNYDDEKHFTRQLGKYQGIIWINKGKFNSSKSILKIKKQKGVSY